MRCQKLLSMKTLSKGRNYIQRKSSKKKYSQLIEKSLKVLNQELGEEARILRKELPHILKGEEFETFKKEIEGFRKKIDTLNEESLQRWITSEKTTMEFLGISKTTMRGIYSIGYRKYEEKNYREAHHIFVLLSMLNPINPSYWIAYGLSSHQLKSYDGALIAYAYAIFLDPEKPEPKWYSAESYLEQGKCDEAEVELKALENLIQQHPLGENWEKIVDELRKKINSRKRF